MWGREIDWIYSPKVKIKGVLLLFKSIHSVVT